MNSRMHLHMHAGVLIILKYDWCNTGTQDAKSSYSTMRDGLYAANRPIVFSICEWGSNKPWEWAGEVGTSYGVQQVISPIHGIA